MRKDFVALDEIDFCALIRTERIYPFCRLPPRCDDGIPVGDIVITYRTPSIKHLVFDGSALEVAT